ncbi:(2Fe-2S)-binding protein [Jatrophihabitans telluris]|uniref:(2Fe-2S)-binding protein n=1 Tax=Jatrophihabitans telluris TaxID=2038343 RepID=A0ABY4QV84_9ACTN|nr:(2Fe-2S)-binding protein [Jatrophihabitans telluris]UQX86889.1 (2Fe-2S)-binding protein [Jatrophihabitans telluris]
MSGDLTVGALRSVARYGPFFEVQLPQPDSAAHKPSPQPSSAPRWRPLSELSHATTVRNRVSRARALLCERLGLPASAVTPRVTGSIVLLGLAARLIAPTFGVATQGGAVRPLLAADLQWQDVDGGPLPLRYRPQTPRGEPGREPVPVPLPATALVSQLFDEFLTPLQLRFETEYRLSRRIVLGNIASAVAGAAQAIARAEPSQARRAAELATAMLKSGPLAGTAEARSPDSPDWAIRRRSCCLSYMLPGTGLCADCVLVPGVR